MKQKGVFILAILFFQLQVRGQASPKFTAMVGGKEGGKMLKGAFLAQQGVMGMRFIGGANHWESIPVDSFSLFVKRDTTILFESKVTGPYFDQRLKSFLSVIQKGDRIVIYGIYGLLPGNVQVFIRPIEFIIE